MSYGVFRRRPIRSFKSPFLPALASDININAELESLQLQTLQASVSLEITVNANSETLSLSTFSSSVEYDYAILAGVESLSLSLSGLSATINLQTNEIAANVELLSYTTVGANISYSQSGWVNQQNDNSVWVVQLNN